MTTICELVTVCNTVTPPPQFGDDNSWAGTAESLQQIDSQELYYQFEPLGNPVFYTGFMAAGQLPNPGNYIFGVLFEANKIFVVVGGVQVTSQIPYPFSGPIRLEMRRSNYRVYFGEQLVWSNQ